MTATKRTPLELMCFGPAEVESVLSTGPCKSYHPIQSPPSQRELSVVMPGARRTIRMSATAHSLHLAIAALAPS